VNGSRRTGARGTSWLLAVLFVAPLLFAFWLYYASDWRPAGRLNHGELIEPPRPLPAIAAGGGSDAAAAATVFRQHWSLVYVGDGRCAADCRGVLYMLRQTHASLGRLSARVQQVFVASSGCCDYAFLGREHPALRIVDASGAQSTGLLAAFPQAQRPASIFVVDPLGNLMMRYDTRQGPTGLRQDLKRLLDLSHIG
jgi:hypothetical protein